MLQHLLELVFHRHHSEFVAAVDDKDDALHVIVYFLPEIAELLRARHVGEREVKVAVCECFERESNGGLDLVDLVMRQTKGAWAWARR